MTCDAKLAGSKAVGRNGRNTNRTMCFTTHLLTPIPTVVKRGKDNDFLQKNVSTRIGS